MSFMLLSAFSQERITEVMSSNVKDGSLSINLPLNNNDTDMAKVDASLVGLLFMSKIESCGRKPFISAFS